LLAVVILAAIIDSVKYRHLSLRLLFCGLFFLSPLLTHAKYYEAMDEALESMHSDPFVKVQEIEMPQWLTNNSFYLFSPRNQKSEKGLIFYPGANVDARSYAPLMRGLAMGGVTVALLNMSILRPLDGIPRAGDVMERIRNIQHWSLAGHSLGGTMAVAFIKDHPEKVTNLILWASYTNEVFDFSESKTPVLSIHGERDGLATVADIEAFKPYLPEHTIYHLIPGANHSHFGSYGDGSPQAGDWPATISREEQQRLVIERSLLFL
jgi:hypothetical protein